MKIKSKFSKSRCICFIVVDHGQPDFLGSPGDPEGGLKNFKGPCV